MAHHQINTTPPGGPSSHEEETTPTARTWQIPGSQQVTCQVCCAAPAVFAIAFPAVTYTACPRCAKAINETKPAATTARIIHTDTEGLFA